MGALIWSPRDGKLVNQWAMDHTTTLAGGRPILALDMYEHSYAHRLRSKGAYVGMFSWRRLTGRSSGALTPSCACNLDW